MGNLRGIDDTFVDEYIFTHRNNLSKPTMGGTDWRFADIVAPAFKDILEIANPTSVLEIGFNIGGSALMFLSINNEMIYDSIDVVKNKKSIAYLRNMYDHFDFFQINSRNTNPGEDGLRSEYDLVFIDGDHSEEGVVNDIEKSLLFNPSYLLFDDWRHPSHDIEKIVTGQYSDKCEVIKVFEFNQCWNGYSMALCKVK